MGNLARLKDAAQSSTLAQYSYDALNRLEHVKDGPTGTPIETLITTRPATAPVC